MKQTDVRFLKLFDGGKHVLARRLYGGNVLSFRHMLFKVWHKVNRDESRQLKTWLIQDSLAVQVFPKQITLQCHHCGKAFTVPFGRRNRACCTEACARAYGGKQTIGRTVRNAVRLWNQGLMQSEIARRLKVSRQRINQILWGHVRELATLLESRPGLTRRVADSCKICGKECLPGRLYCSKRCRTQGLRRSDAPWSRYAILTLVCETCGRKFQRSRYIDSLARHNNSLHVYCSRRCANQRNYGRTGLTLPKRRSRRRLK